MLISYRDFERERKLGYNVVGMYIRRHPELADQVAKRGKQYYLDTDTDAYRILSDMHPMPDDAPSKIAQESEKLKEKLAEYRDRANRAEAALQIRENDINDYKKKVDSLYEKIEELTKQTTGNDADQVLQIRENGIDDYEEKIKSLYEKIEELTKQVSQKDETINELCEPPGRYDKLKDIAYKLQLQEQIENLKKENEKLKKENAELKAQLSLNYRSPLSSI